MHTTESVFYYLNNTSSNRHLILRNTIYLYCTPAINKIQTNSKHEQLVLILSGYLLIEWRSVGAVREECFISPTQ